MSNPSHDDIVHNARETIDLIFAIANDSRFNKYEYTKSPTTARNVFGFVKNTWTEYFAHILPGSVKAELMKLGEADNVKFWESAVVETGFTKTENWPRLKKEMYGDALGRNYMIGDIVLSKQKQMMFGGEWAFGEEAKAVARRVTGKA